MKLPFTCSFLVLNAVHMALRTGWELTFEPYPFSSLGLFWPGVVALLLTGPLGLLFDGFAGMRQWMARRCQKT